MLFHDSASPEPSPEIAVAKLATGPRQAGLRRGLALLLFLACILPLALWRLGAVEVMAMEGIVADGARHMIRTGEIWVPRLHGEIYTFKPPFAYWMAAASFELFGARTEWTLRLPFVLSGLLMAVTVFVVVARRLGRRAGLLGGLASLTGHLTVQKLRLAEFDMPLAAGVGVATALAIAQLTDDEPPAWRWQVAYLALAAAFLAKGMPALMFFAPGLLLAVVATGSWRRLLGLPHLAAVGTFLLCVGVWLAGAWTAEGWAAFEQPLRESRQKGLSWNLDSLGQTLLKPGVLLVAFFPWTLALPLAFRPGLWDRLDARARSIATAAAAFVLGGLLAYMTVPAMETRYFLPLATPMGILCGIVLARGGAGELFRRVARVSALVVGSLLAAGAPLLVRLGELEIPFSDALLVSVGGLVVATFALVVPGLDLRHSLASAALVTALALVLWCAYVAAVAPHRAHSRSLRDLAADFRTHLGDDEPVWAVPVHPGYRHSSLTFYLRRPIETFDAAEPPPAGSAVILFGDEPMGLGRGTPFEYCTLEKKIRRGIGFALVRVKASGTSCATSRR